MKISRLGWKMGIGAMALLLALSGWSGKPVHAASASSVASPSSVSIGSDISGHWAESTLRAWIQEGLLTGDEQGRVDPDRTITRAELMTLANRALGLTEAGPIAFSDVKATAWYADQIAIAVQAGYVSGYSDGTVRPNRTVTRQETAAMLASLAKKPLGAYAGTAGESVGFADSSAIGTWSLEAVKAVARLQIMGGFTDGTFRPISPITRAEAIVALDRLKKLAPVAEQEEDKVYSEAGTYGPESGQEVISGDVAIQVGGVTLRNVTIKGDLTLTKEVGEGDVTLDHVTIEGETFVYGGGANSVHFIDSIIASLLVNKEGSSIRILAQGTSQIASAEFRSMATFVVETGAKVETFIVRAVVKVTGQGVIVNARLYVSGISFDSKPQNIEAADGIQYFIGTVIPGGSSGGGPVIDAAPTVTGVVYGKTYTSAVTPASADADIASVTLAKDGATVAGYKLGDEIAENGSYVLTVTDLGRNSTVVSFIVNIPAPDLAPVVTGVENGKTYTVAVTPSSSDEDIASVELTKDEAIVEGYELGDEISENGSYVLTVTDLGGHATVVSFIVNIPPPDLAPVIAGVEDGETYTVAVTPTSADEDIAS
ncbi:S-layer homology domain-containing protein, partial [Cohnella thailandensis]